MVPYDIAWKMTALL